MNDDEFEIEVKKPNATDLEWLDYGRQILKESPKVIDEDAKSLVALGSSLLTVYIGALTLLNFNEKLAPSVAARILLIIPIVVWLMSISFNAYVYFPRRYAFREDKPEDIKDAQKRIINTKHFRLKIGAVLFVMALALSSFCILWLSNQGQQLGNEKQVQFVASKEIVTSLQDLSIPFEKGTQRTVPLTLLESKEKAYLVQLPDGGKAEFNKDMVEGIIYD